MELGGLIKNSFLWIVSMKTTRVYLKLLLLKQHKVIAFSTHVKSVGVLRDDLFYIALSVFE